jgi:uncharacterized protein (UPF0218 family)
MISLAGGPIVRPSGGVAATGDWTTLVALVVVMAIAFVAIAVIDYRINRKARQQQARKSQPADSERKVA